jgi:hypothetical protein
MREARKTIIVATLAAMLLKLESQLPIARAQAWIECVRISAVDAPTSAAGAPTSTGA